MIRETYKGRKIRVVKGSNYGMSRIFINDVNNGEWMGSQEDVAASWKRTIDDVDTRPFEGRWAECLYAPGTYELNEHGHVVAPNGGICSCEYCVARTPQPASTPVDEEPATTHPAYIAKDTYTGKHSVTRLNPKTSVYTAGELAAMASESAVFTYSGTVGGRSLFVRNRYVADADGNLYCYDSEGAWKGTHPAARRLRVLVG